MIKEFLFCAAALVAMSQSAIAQDSAGFYFGARGGLVWLDDAEETLPAGLFAIPGFGASPAADVEASYDLGWSLGAAVGYDFGKVASHVGIRTELEVGFQQSEVDKYSASAGGTTVSTTSADGDTDVFYGFANLYGDVALTQTVGLILGGGVGLGRVNFDGHGGAISAGGVTGSGAIIDDTDTAFGYHLDAGVSLGLTERASLEAMYRYSAFIDAELKAATAAGVPAFKTEQNVSSHQALVGLRYKF